MTLEQIISGCKKNEPKAQEQLYVLFSKKFFGLCLKYSSSYEIAEDNLQDGFIQIFKTINQYKNQGSFEGWAKRVVINVALQKFREKKHLEIVSNSFLAIDDDVAQDDDDFETTHLSETFLLKLIQDLPERYRLVFNLYAIDGFSHTDIAKMLSIGIGTSKSNLFRARAILKEKIITTQQNLSFYEN